MDKTSNALPDVQNLMDGRNIPIDRVGIRGLTVPLQVQSVSAWDFLPTSVARICRASFRSLPTTMLRFQAT